MGGAKTSKSGADFEDSTHKVLINDLEGIGYRIQNLEDGNKGPRTITLVKNQSETIELFFKAALHKSFFELRGVRSLEYFSARLEPDTAIFSPKTNTLTIIEKKQQKTTGSVAEKLQTCDYKMFYYQTLCKPIGVEVDLIWQLGEYFKSQERQLKSVFDYMESKGSSYYFHKVPVNKLKI